MDKHELTETVKLVQLDKSQFEKLYNLVINKVYFWCYNMTGNKSDANDLAQDSMLLIYRKIGTLEHPEYFTSWMYKTVRRVGYNHSRKMKVKYYPLIEDDDFHETYASQLEDKRIESVPEMALDLKQTKELMLDFIEKLPRKQKEVVYLHYLEELKIEEIADILDYNAGTIKASLFKARQNLKGQIESYQMKNNVRLYSMGFVPLVVLAFEQYFKDICKMSHQMYNPKHFKPSIGSILRSQVFSMPLITTTVAIAAVVVGVVIYFPTSKQEEISPTGIQEEGNQDITSKESSDLMSEKIKKKEYILSYRYYHFPSNSVPVSIEVSTEMNKDEVSVLLNSKEISTQQDSNIIQFEAEENGKYEIKVKNEMITIDIKNITPNAPILNSVNNNLSNAYIELNINGNSDLIDYSKSYVMYQNKQYSISDDNIVKGQFREQIQVTLFDRENNYIEYTVDLSQQ